MARTNSSLLTRIAASFCKFTLALGAALGIVSAANADYVMKAGTTTANWSDEGLWVGEGGNYVITWEAPNADITFTAAESIASGFWIENADGLVKFEASDPTYGLTMTTGDMHVGGVNHGYLEIDSGTYVFQNDLYIAYSKAHWYDGDKGSFTVKGGSVTVGNSIVVANYGGVDGTVGELYISGGTLATKTIVAGAGAGKVEFYGGTLKATAAGTLIGSGLTVNVPAGYSGTIDTAGFDVTVAPAVGGSGSLNIVGGGKVTFTVRPACEVSSSDETPYVMPDPPAADIPDGAYCWIGPSAGSWNDGANWSMSINGPAANDYPKAVLTDVAYIGNATTISLSGTASASNVICAANVTFTGGGTLMSYSVNGSGIVSLNGARLQTPRTDYVNNADLEVVNDIVVSGDNTLVLTASTRIRGGKLRLSGDISGAGNITVAKSDANDTYGEAVLLGGNNAGFTGTYTVSLTKGSRGNNSYANKFLSPTSGSAAAAWSIFFGGEPSTSDGLFEFSDGVIEFGALSARFPAYTSSTYGGNTVKVGALGAVDNISGSWGVSAGNGVEKIGTGTLNYGVANTANITVKNGSVVVTDGNALPSAALTFADSGGVFAIGEDVESGVNTAAVIPNASGTISIGSADITLGSISGGNSAAVVTKEGVGRLTFSSASATAAGLDITAGSVALAVGSSIGTLSMSDGTILAFAADPQWGSEQQVNLFTYDSENSNVTLSKDNVKIEGLGGSSDYTLDVVDGTVVATVTAPTLVWASSSGVWDSGTPWSANGNAMSFHAGDKVSFTDAPFSTYGVASITVTINEAVAPSHLSVDVAQGHTYIFEGAAIDSDSMTFSKTGAGDLVLRTAAPENLPAEFSLAGGGLVLGNDSLHGMTITPAGGSLRVDSAIDNGDGTVTTNAVVLADVVSNDINANWVVINSGKLVLTNGMSASITNNSELELKGSFNVSRYLNGTGATYIADGAFVNYNWARGTSYYWNDYSGSLWLLPGGTLNYFVRVDHNHNCFGKGKIYLAGGTLQAADANSPQDITLANAIEAVENTTTTIRWVSGNNRRSMLRFNGALTGSGTINEENDVVRLAGDNSGFYGFWNYGKSSGTIGGSAMGILSNKSSSSNAVWSITGTPESLTSLYYIEHQSANQTAYFNGLNLNSPNGAIYCKNPLQFVVGENGGDSVIAGALALQNAGDYSITKKGAGKLALGTGFRMANATSLGLSGSNDYSANAQTKSITVQDGVFSVENRDLADISVTIEKEATVDLDRSMGLSVEEPADRTTVYTIFQTTGSLSVVTRTSVVSETTTHRGKWKLFVEEMEGTRFLRAKYFSEGTSITLR